MDKIKIFLATAKKHQFWVCCGVMLLTSLGCWWWACGNLSDLFKKRSSEIDGDFTSATVQPGIPTRASSTQSRRLTRPRNRIAANWVA